MSRLYGDQLQASGRRFYFALDGAPGIITPATATLALFGRVPAAAEPSTVFRTPAPALLNFIGQSLGAPVVLTPAPAALAYQGRIAGLVTTRIITNALPEAVENPPQDFSPTLITVWHATPDPAQLTLNALPFALTQGGNIGFVSPAAAQISLQSLQYILTYGEVGLGGISIEGLAPTLVGETVVTPEPAALSVRPTLPELALPFRWVDDAPARSTTWITDAAA